VNSIGVSGAAPAPVNLTPNMLPKLLLLLMSLLLVLLFVILSQACVGRAEKTDNFVSTTNLVGVRVGNFVAATILEIRRPQT
jgi:hypothetical protein